MNPLLFPMTHVSADMMDLLCSVLNGMTVYRPWHDALPSVMQTAVDRQFLEICIPVSGGEAFLEDLTRAYETWADQHRGADINAMLSVDAPIPFFEDTSVSQIVSTLRGRLGSDRNSDHAPDPVTKARILLTLAQISDSHNEALQADLDRISRMEQSLFEHMHGSVRPGVEAAPGAPPAADPCIEKTDQRLRAWAQLALQDNQPRRLLVTTSPSVTASVLEYVTPPDDRAALRLPGAPADNGGEIDLRRHVTDAIAALAADTPSDDLASLRVSEEMLRGGQPIHIRLFRWTRMSFPGLCRTLVKAPIQDADVGSGSGLTIVEFTRESNPDINGGATPE